MQKYSIQSRLIHWLMAVIIFITLFLGIYIEYILDKSTSNNVIELYNLHKSFGFVALILVFFRILNRFITKPPLLPSTFGNLQIKIINLVHIILYILMVTVPLSGFAMSMFSGYGINFFGIEITSTYQNYQLAKISSIIHKFLAISIAILIIGHIFFAIKHIFDKNQEKNIIKRII